MVLAHLFFCRKFFIGNTRGWFWLTGFSKFFLVLEISGRWCIKGECVIRGKWGISGKSGKFCAHFYNTYFFLKLFLPKRVVAFLRMAKNWAFGRVSREPWFFALGFALTFALVSWNALFATCSNLSKTLLLAAEEEHHHTHQSNCLTQANSPELLFLCSSFYY